MISVFLILMTFVPLSGTAPALDYGTAPLSGDYPSGIPVITYHQVSLHQSKYSVTPVRLRSDLRQLYEAGFFLILPTDIQNGLRRVPFDRSPLMITFDDGWEDNFRFLDDGSIDPDCAVAIVNEFLEEHPDFGIGVVFFISWDKVPFGNNTEEKLNRILDMGHYIGNHSQDHLDFNKLTPSHYRDQILPALHSFYRKLGLRTAGINVVAYPGGNIPRGIDTDTALASLEFRGRPAVVQGYLVNGAVSSFKGIYESDGDGMFRIGRIDMALYSVPQLLGWSNIITRNDTRTSLHDALPWRPINSE